MIDAISDKPSDRSIDRSIMQSRIAYDFAVAYVMDGLLRGFYTEEHMSTVKLSGVTKAPLTEQLDQIFREHHQLVYRTAYGVTGSREDAQDVVQTIFLRLLRRTCPPDLHRNPKAYLYRAAVNLSLNTVRLRRRHLHANDAERFEDFADTSESDSAEELHQRLYEAIAELDPEAAHTLILRYVHNYRISEIAALLGKSRSVIAVRLFRSRAQLKRLIHASQEGPS